jgi:hypothetical protein
MAQKDINQENTEEKEEKVVIKPKKKKLTGSQKRKLIMKVMGWIMAIAMIGGSLLSIFGLLIYR